MTMAQGESLRLTRVFRAPRSVVFRAWTEVEQLKRWFCPNEHWGLEVEVDPQVGGTLRVVMKDRDANHDHVVRGTFREVRPPERLVFTWRWGDQPGFPETLVTVEFHDRGQETEVVLTHEALPTAESRDRHTHGWNGCLDRLAKLVEPNVGPGTVR
jgi:uncharacterized protein YndB with AHSA1/START domain